MNVQQPRSQLLGPLKISHCRLFTIRSCDGRTVMVFWGMDPAHPTPAVKHAALAIATLQRVHKHTVLAELLAEPLHDQGPVFTTRIAFGVHVRSK